MKLSQEFLKRLQYVLDRKGLTDLPDGDQFQLRLNLGNSRDLQVWVRLEELKFENRASDYVKALVYERDTGLSWVDGRPLPVGSGGTVPAPVSGMGKAQLKGGSDNFDDDSDYVADDDVDDDWTTRVGRGPG